MIDLTYYYEDYKINYHSLNKDTKFYDIDDNIYEYCYKETVNLNFDDCLEIINTLFNNELCKYSPETVNIKFLQLLAFNTIRTYIRKCLSQKK